MQRPFFISQYINIMYLIVLIRHDLIQISMNGHYLCWP